MQRLLIDQANITKTRVEDVPSPDLAAGQSRLRIRRFAVTANNVTYAAAGFVIGYWNFFPTGVDGQGLVPVWGFAEVVDTRSDVLAVGERLYGFYPLAEEVVIEPKAQGEYIVLDAAAHRAELPVIYNQYTRTSEKAQEREGLQAILQPLLATSFLLSDWLQDNAYFDAKQVIVGSASSKTGLGLCKFLAGIEGHPVDVIGLTSAGNAEFVQSLGACDRVVTYDDIETLASVPSVYVDMAGNAQVKERLHTHLADVLVHSSAVGTSHWDQFNPGLKLAGPKPQFFFAPAQAEKRRAEWGSGVVEQKIAAAWKGVAADADGWLEVRVHEGIAAAAEVYGDVARGGADPRHGHVVEFG